jgi:hypothetical protein
VSEAIRGTKTDEFPDIASLIRATPATSTALAEAGATPPEIMAVTGHQTLEEVERYTKAASRKKTADAAMAKLRG